MNPQANGLVIDDRSFQKLSKIVHEECGIVLSASKKSLLVSRLSRRLRELRIDSFSKYCDFLEAGKSEQEILNITSLLTTNVTRFFREEHHFASLREDVLPPLIKSARKGGRLRIWSAGCSTGEEPYSIAMQLLEAMPDAARYDVKILATDVDIQVVRAARLGVYRDTQDSGIPQVFINKFAKVADGQLQIIDEVKDLVSVTQLNLMKKWPMEGKFDVIFCRNVAIYFDTNTQNELWKKFANYLKIGGRLFIGHSERVNVGPGALLAHSGVTQYQRI